MVNGVVAMRFVRYSLVLIFLAFGYAKFFPYEAAGVEPLIGAHPALSWLLGVFGQTGASRFLGVTELTAGVLLAAHPLSSRLGVIGGALGMITFATTVTEFLFVPGLFDKSIGFPAISAMGGFLLKDVVLFSASLACFAESVEASRLRR